MSLEDRIRLRAFRLYEADRGRMTQRAVDDWLLAERIELGLARPPDPPGASPSNRQRRPLPFDSNSPDTIILPREISRVLVRIAAGQLAARPSLGTIRSWAWGDHDATGGDTELVIDDDGLAIAISGFRRDGDQTFHALTQELNLPSTLKLEDDSTLAARFTHLESIGSAFKVGTPPSQVALIRLSCWKWLTQQKPVAWIARVKGRKLPHGNLAICTSTRATSRALRIEASHRVVLMEVGEGELMLVVEGQTLEEISLGMDIQALEFALGSPLEVGDFLAVDDALRVVGAADFGFGNIRSTKAHREPVPDMMDGNCWVASFATHVAHRMAQEPGEDLPLLIASSAYLDSLSGHVHARYLLAQVGLEAVAKGTSPKRASAHLVRSIDDWRAFVAAHKAAIEALAATPEAAVKLLNKLNYNVFQPPVSDAVEDALTHHNIQIPVEATKELRGRNTAAHDFVMFRDSDPDVDRLIERIEIVQTMLVALAAKHSGYPGPISSWKLERGRSAAASWWSHDGSCSVAHRRYLALSDELIENLHR